MSASRRQSALRKTGERLDAKGKRAGASTTGGKLITKASSRVDKLKGTKKEDELYEKFRRSKEKQIHVRHKDQLLPGFYEHKRSAEQKVSHLRSSIE